jgi:lysophospholipase
VETFDTYLSDLCLFLQRHVFCSATRPPIVLGHSMGAHLALRLAHDLPGLFERLVLVSPMIDIQTRPLPRWLAPLLAGVGLGMGLGTRAVPSWGSHNPDRAVFQDNPLTSDRGRFEREAALIAAHPELGLGGVTFAWLAASLRSMELLMAPGFAEAIDLPVLCIGAGGDRIVSVGAQQRFCMRLPQGLFVCLEQARHEILQERDALRQDLWRHFDRFCGTAEEAAAAAR